MTTIPSHRPYVQRAGPWGETKEAERPGSVKGIKARRSGGDEMFFPAPSLTHSRALRRGERGPVMVMRL